MGTVTERLSPEAAREAARGFPDWDCDGQSLCREFKRSGFRDAIAFVNRVADAAERADHHPDILIRYDVVRFELSSHDAGGLTARDFALARAIDGLA